MVKKYARLLETRQINEKTDSIWSINDVPGTWRNSTETKVVSDGYFFDIDGTAYPNPEDEEVKE